MGWWLYSFSRIYKLAHEQNSIVDFFVYDEQKRTIAYEIERLLSVTTTAHVVKRRSGRRSFRAVLVHANHRLVNYLCNIQRMRVLFGDWAKVGSHRIKCRHVT